MSSFSILSTCKKWVCLSLGITFFLSVSGQESLSSDTYFRQSLEEFDQLRQEYANAGFRPSWLEEIDIRTETNDFEPDRQRYLLRVSPSTGRIRKAQSELHRQYRAGATLEWEKERADWIVRAYAGWLQLYEHSRNLEGLRQLLVVLLDQQLVIQRLAAAAEISIKEVLEIQQDIQEVRIEIFAMEQELNALRPSAGNPDFTDLIPLNAIRQSIRQNPPGTYALRYTELEQEMRVNTAELQLEKAEGGRIFDFLQMEYNGPHNDLWREKVRLGLGLNIPLASDRKLKMEELRIEQEAIRAQTALEKNLDSRSLSQQISSLEGLFATLDYATELLEAGNRQGASIVQKGTPESFSTPLRQLYQKEMEIKNGLQLQAIEQDIYEEYIKLLAVQQVLFQLPFVNYLKDK